MRKKILIVAAAFLVFGTTIAGVAYQRTTNATGAAMACCCKGESCPMKSKSTASGEAMACCDDPNCCCKGGESCPMKKGEASHATTAEMKQVAADGETSCCSCSCCKKDSRT